MEKESLQQIIDQLESENSDQTARFGIYEEGEGSNTYFIQANAPGLERFAAELLKASKDAERISFDEPPVHKLDYYAGWVDARSKVFLHYVQPILEKEERHTPEPHKETWGSILMKIGFIVLLVLGLAVSVTGLVTIVRWLF